MATNSNGTLTWKVLTIIFIPIMLFMGNNIIANDKVRQNEDKEIRQELAQDRKDINEKLTNVVQALASINTELKYIRKYEPSNP